MLVGLIGLTGTDFTRGLPLLSGKTVYEQLPGIWLRLAAAFDPATRQLRPDATLDRVVAALYQRKFDRHAQPGTLDDVLGALGGSKLSDRTKKHLPTREVLHCTVRNVNWLLRCSLTHLTAQAFNWLPHARASPSLTHLASPLRGGRYWEEPQYPDPVQPEYGFARVGGAVRHEA
jgi:hypothetical protein